MTTDAVIRRLAALAIPVAGGVHLDLWLFQGYRSIHVIGPLFLLKAAAAAVVAALLLARGGTLVELTGLAYAAGTLAAFFVSVYHGLFGFLEVLDGTPQLLAAATEAIAIGLLLFTLAHAGGGVTLGRSSFSSRGGLGRS